MALDWTSYGGASLWGPDRSAQTRAYQEATAQRAAEQARAGALEDAYRQDDTERLQRAQLESDREYKLRVDAAKRQAEQIAIQKGQAKATEWYNRQMVQIAKDKLAEERRQYDMTFGENQRQFNTTASGYLDGRPTLAREQFQNSALLDWTKEAIRLASTPKDWVGYKRMTSGVASNIGSIPGLNWTSGGQVGNTTFAGNPETNSLTNVFGNMGVGTGAGGGGWASQAAQQAQQIASTPLNLNSQEQQIYQTADEFARNPQGAAPGWYDSLDPMTRDLLEGAAAAQGHDWSTVMARMKRASWGGGGSAMAA